jgi:hypothetical protein
MERMSEKSRGVMFVKLADGSINPAVIERVHCDIQTAPRCEGRPNWGLNFIDHYGDENEICFYCFERLAGVELRNQP